LDTAQAPQDEASEVSEPTDSHEVDASNHEAASVPDGLVATETQIEDLASFAEEISPEAVEEVKTMRLRHKAGVPMGLYRMVRQRLERQQVDVKG
jgi:hypothetical protein